MLSNMIKKLSGKKDDQKQNGIEHTQTVGSWIGAGGKTIQQPLDKTLTIRKPIEEPKKKEEFKVDLTAIDLPTTDKNTSGNNSILDLSTEAIKVSSSSTIEEEVATIFSEGENKNSIEILKKYVNVNKAMVAPRIWFMLMDLYQITENKVEFDKTALAFAHITGSSPPSWFGDNPSDKKDSIGGGKNMMILEPVLKAQHIEKFKDFLKFSREEKFCRINVSQCKFEQNDIVVFERLLKLFVDLRKAKVTAVLMGDNTLTTFCKNYIYPSEKKNLNQDFINNEETLWLIYLEILQWKGLHEEFENVAINYAEKFEMSPPGWETNGVMKINNINLPENENDVAQFDKILNSNNINPVLNYISEQFNSNKNAEIDFSNIERIDFSAAGSITFHIQELLTQEKNFNKKVVFKYPNELIIILLEMVGVNEFVEIIPRIRK